MRPDMADHSKPARSDSNASTNRLAASRLNPYAQEFVPAPRPQPRTYYPENSNPEYDYRYYDNGFAYQQPPSTSSVQHRLRNKRPSLNTTEEFQEFMYSPKYDAISKMNEVIDLLNNKPARYDNIIGALSDLMAEHLTNKEFIQTTVKLLTNQAIIKPNFRYNAARICVLFYKMSEYFRLFLLKECQQDMQRYVDVAKIDINFFEKDLSVCGVALFVSEIYIQVIAADNYDNTSLKDLANGLLQILNLMTRSDRESIKTVCQALKLCGQQLSSRNPEGLSHLISKLSDIPKQLNDISIERLVGSVVTLSRSSWGQSESPLSIAHTQILDSFSEGAHGTKYVQGRCTPIVFDETTYYGPDGQIISEEESKFLRANLETPAENDDYSGDENGDDGDSLWDPHNEIDPEIQAAFKEFVQYSAQYNG